MCEEVSVLTSASILTGRLPLLLLSVTGILHTEREIFNPILVISSHRTQIDTKKVLQQHDTFKVVGGKTTNLELNTNENISFKQK